MKKNVLISILGLLSSFTAFFLSSCSESTEVFYFNVKLFSDNCKTCNIADNPSLQNSVKHFREQILKWKIVIQKDEKRAIVCEKKDGECRDYQLVKKNISEYSFSEDKKVDKISFEDQNCIKKSESKYVLTFQKNKAFLEVKVFWEIEEGCCQMFGWQDKQKCVLKFKGMTERKVGWWKKLFG